MALLPLPACEIFGHFSNLTSSSSSSYGHLRLASPLFRIRCRRITRPSLATCAELQTSSPAEATTKTASTSIPTHRVTVHDRQRGVVHEFVVPEVADDPLGPFVEANLGTSIYYTLPSRRTYPCPSLAGTVHTNIINPSTVYQIDQSVGCCTSCAVRIKSGQIRQPEALGISAELKEKGYALLCVGFPSSDTVVETQDEDEVYWLQFGRYFARGPIERDDYALELAMGDE